MGLHYGSNVAEELDQLPPNRTGHLPSPKGPRIQIIRVVRTQIPSIL